MTLKRSRSSLLTGDELVVLDSMFDVLAPRRMLSRERYSSAFNVRQTHSLDETALDECLRDLAERGIIFLKRSQKATWYGLTPVGGALWDDERKPDWNLYCQVYETPSNGDRCPIEVVAFSRDVGAHYLAGAKDSGRFPDYEPQKLVWKRVRKPAIYWMPEPRAWRARLVLRKSGWKEDPEASEPRGSWSGLIDLVLI